MKQAFMAPNGPKPAGPYSHAIRAGDFLFVSGQGPTDPATGRIAGDDITTQTRQTLQNITTIVEAAGGRMANAVKVTAYLTDLANFSAYNEVYRTFFPEPFPARTTVGTALLGILVEIDAIIYMGE